MFEAKKQPQKQDGIEVKIKSFNFKPFKLDEGGERDWYWYKANRVSDNLAIEIGSTEKHEVGQTLTLILEKREKATGKFWYKEITL